MRMMMSGGLRRSCQVGFASVVLSVGALTPWGAVGATVSPPSTTPARIQLQGPDRLGAGGHVVAPLPSSTIVQGSVGLAPGDAQGLAHFAAGVSTPGSPLFHKYLAPGQFRQQFGPSVARVDAVVASLGQQGLTTSVSSNGLLVSFRGSVGGLQSLFGTTLSKVALPTGQSGIAATRSLSVPATLAGDITGVFGLSTSTQEAPALRRVHQGTPPTLGGRLRPVAASSPSPSACADAAATASQYNGLTDAQVAHAYGADGLYAAGARGQGQSVAIFELEPFAMSDISTFESCYFGSQAAAQLSSQVSVVPVLGGLPQGPGSGESELDIENVLALAPQAHVDVYEAPNSNAGVAAEYNQIVQDDHDKVISTSWGQCEETSQLAEPGLLSFENSIFEQAAAQGQTVFAAAGDSGSSDCGSSAISGGTAASPADLSVDDPASQPYVVGVGGTTTLDATNPPVQSTWNDGSQWGSGGGGLSEVWPQTAWQGTPSVPGVNSSQQIAAAKSTANVNGIDFAGAFCEGQALGSASGPCRQVPDVSANADEFGGAITVFEAGSWWTIGGTSSAAPIWAALVADAASLTTCSSGSGIGFVAPELYAVAANPTTYALGFNDVTLGSNDVNGSNGGLFASSSGYDMASGLGTPKMTSANGGVGLGALLCGFQAPARPTVTSITPSTVSPSGALSITIHGTGFSSTGPGAVSGVQVGSVNLGTVDYAVTSNTTITATIPSVAELTPAAASNAPAQSSPFGAGRFAVVVSLASGESSAPGPGSLLDYVQSGTGGSSVPTIIGVESGGGPEAGGNQVTIVGEGFSGATSVTFGGVPAASFSVISNTQISATAPSYVPESTTCAPTGTDPTTDVCQAQVVVTGPGGTSSQSPIASPFNVALLNSGALAASSLSAFLTACGCEIAPAASEYDYFPAPVITSAQVNGGYLSENGGGIVTLTGTGFDPFAVVGVVTGDPSQATSWQNAMPMSVSPTTMVVSVSSSLAKPTLRPISEELRVATVASPDAQDWGNSTIAPSNSALVKFAGVPQVTGISSATSPASGGAQVTITGVAMSDVNQITIDGIRQFPHQAPSSAIQTVFSSQTSTSVTFLTPSALPGPANVSVCTASGCGGLSTLFRYYSPGAARVQSVSQSSGPHGGGNTITIRGVNLGCAQFVSFGGSFVVAHRLEGVTGCGNTGAVTAVVPAGTAGHRVTIRVLTLEGVATKSGYSSMTGAPSYTYR